MKEQITKAIEYLKAISLKKPDDFRVEEAGGRRIVLSYREDDRSYFWQDRIYKEFDFDPGGNVISMKSFNPKP